MTIQAGIWDLIVLYFQIQKNSLDLSGFYRKEPESALMEEGNKRAMEYNKNKSKTQKTTKSYCVYTSSTHFIGGPELMNESLNDRTYGRLISSLLMS